MARETLISDLLTGLALGLTTVLIWGCYMTFSKSGVLAGLQPVDFAFLRFLPAGLISLPFLLSASRNGKNEIGWAKCAWITLLAGPLFVMMTTGGYKLAPLSHGAVLQPSTAAISGMVLGWLILGEPADRHRIGGMIVILCGVAVLGASRPSAGLGPYFLIGDALFVITGLSWTAYTILLKRWSLQPVQATAAISVLSMCLVVPPYLAFVGTDRLLALPTFTLLGQIAVHGIGAGFLALVFYASAAQRLGAGRAALFPGLVPPTAIMLGIPVAGIWPSPFEWLGATLAAFGLLIAIGLLARRRKPAAMVPATPN